MAAQVDPFSAMGAIDDEATYRERLADESCQQLLAVEAAARAELESRIAHNDPGGTTTTSDPTGTW